ncbi:MAG: pyridoxal 5'-phosphate synthase glutaminase subunit PdxT [candidate division Zixibacteria bacterium]|nr:pyridoxal 5'-phosphate synthase glutaminase subunit PdxT [candidate division Zixibacteria bacterium]
MAEKKIKLVRTDENVYEVGILALQGDFELHTKALKKAGQEALLIKTADELKRIKRLIIPGGESTTMNKLIDIYNMRQPLLEFGKKKPVWGTCAGLVMLSKDAGDKRVQPFGLIDIDSVRNAYGRQIHSFSKKSKISLNGRSEAIELVFIRAPKITRSGKQVQILAELDGEAVMARQGNILVSAFHPELSDSTMIHEYFLKM